MWLRLCAVWNGTPNEGGHAQPLVSTYTIAANTARARLEFRDQRLHQIMTHAASITT